MLRISVYDKAKRTCPIIANLVLDLVGLIAGWWIDIWQEE